MKHRTLLFLLILTAPFVQGEGPIEAIRVEIGSHPTAKFDPHEALGAGLDGHWQGETGSGLKFSKWKSSNRYQAGKISALDRGDDTSAGYDSGSSTLAFYTSANGTTGGTTPVERMSISNNGQVHVGPVPANIAEYQYGASWTFKKYLTVSGNNTTDGATTTGVLGLTNNRATASAGDTTGSILFASLNNGGTGSAGPNSRIVGKIESALLGTGVVTGGFAGRMDFYVKDDNSLTMTSPLSLVGNQAFLAIAKVTNALLDSTGATGAANTILTKQADGTQQWKNTAALDSVTFGATGNAGIAVIDERTVYGASGLPDDMTLPRVRFGFNRTDSLGLNIPGTGSYAGIMHMRPFGGGSDWTGGSMHDLAFKSGGSIWHRIGMTGIWGPWQQLVDTTGSALLIDSSGATGTVDQHLIKSVN